MPASALIFDQGGLRVATVGADDRVVLKQVTIARDLGQRGRDRHRASPPTIASSRARRTASPTGDQVRVAKRTGPNNAAENAPKPAQSKL